MTGTTCTKVLRQQRCDRSGSEHGTHVAGIIAANRNNNLGLKASLIIGHDPTHPGRAAEWR